MCYGNTLSTEDHKVVADTTAAVHGTADPDKDKPYRPAQVMSEVTRNQQWSDGVDWTDASESKKAATTFRVTQ